MSSPLEQAGAVREPSEYAALSMDRGITGLWTQRSPLRDADVPYLYGKFYSASRFDSLIDGINREITAKLTYARRPGSSVYNSSLFPAANSFYSYKRINSANGSEVVRVLLDGVDGTVYDATAGQKTAIFAKGAGAGKARFAGVNTSLYIADGVENKKWLQPGPWTAQTSMLTTQYAVGDTILDNESPTPRLQYLASAQVATVTNVQVKTKSVILTCSGTNFNVLPGMTFTLALGTATFLNGKLLIAQTVAGNNVIAFFDHPDYASTPDTGTAITTDAGTLATTGATQPSWATSYGATTTDGLSIWTNFGNPLYNWTPQPPLQAPSLAPIGDCAATFWRPFTGYGLEALLDQNGFIQMPSALSAAEGWQSGGSVPQFASPVITQIPLSIGGNASSGIPPATIFTGVASNGITADGAAQWLSSFWLGSFAAVNTFSSPFSYSTQTIVVLKGPQPWQASTLIAVLPSEFGGGPLQGGGGDVCVDSNGNLQIVSSWTTSGAAKTGSSAPSWNTTYGGQTTDNNITWVNLGPYLAIAFQGRQYGYAYHSVDSGWTTLSPLSDSTNGLLEGVQVGGVYSSDLQVDSVGVFHTPDGESTPLLLALVPNLSGGPFSGIVNINISTNTLTLVSGTSFTPAMVGSPIRINGTQYVITAYTSSTVVSYNGTGLGGDFDFAITGWVFNDEWNDEALNAEIAGPQNEANNPPPVGMTAPLYHLGRIWAIDENAVICSGGPDTVVGNGLTAFPPLNSFPIPEQPIRLFPTITSQGPGVLIFGRANRYIILGTGTPSNPFQPAAQYEEGGGILSYDAVCKRGSTFHYFGDTGLVGGNVVGKVISLDPGAGDVEIGFPIGDQFKSVTTGAGGRIANSGVPLGYLYNPANAFVSYADLGSGDTGIYVADGSVGWFRCSPVASPESGYLWSPRAVIVPGTSAVEAIETQPGVTQLLIGPSGVVAGEGSLANNVLTWTGGPQFNSGMVGLTVTLVSGSGSTTAAVSGFIDATHLTLGVTFPPTPAPVSWSLAQNGPILFRDSTVNGDWYGGAYQAYPSYDVKGCIQMCQTGEVAEIAHVHLVSMPQGARPYVGLLFDEILPTSAAPFAWYSRTSAEPPTLMPSETVYSDRYTMLQSGVTPKCLFFQLGMDYGTQDFPDETLLFSVFGAKFAERRQQ